MSQGEIGKILESASLILLNQHLLLRHVFRSLAVANFFEKQ